MTDKPNMGVEKRQAKLAKNSEAHARWMRRLFRVVSELRKLEAERKRLLNTPGRKAARAAYKSLQDIPHLAGGGDEFNDDIPL